VKILLHIILSPLYLLVALQVAPLLLFFAAVAVIHFLERRFPPMRDV
jgi:hypothetical protein